VLQLNIRAYSEQTRSTLIGAIRRIVAAECAASGSPRELELEPFGAYRSRTTTSRLSRAWRRPSWSSSATGPRSCPGRPQRGLQRHPHRAGCSLHLLGHRRGRPGPVPGSGRGGPGGEGHPGQPQPRVRPGGAAALAWLAREQTSL